MTRGTPAAAAGRLAVRGRRRGRGSAATRPRAARPRLREWLDAAMKRKAIENEPNGDPNDSAPERPKPAKPLFVL
ncbi:hypothetical protein WS54_22030 [Burkholderia sp. NRF60-BP8]|nr:hypothetical protein WS54_22030 [Burkholderia sp. NRF60-BP8]KVA13529.1 hypothetical protein WS54_13920 [Burkholderia sp. NRF60-BP8]